MTQDGVQTFRVDIYRLLRGELSVAVNSLDVEGETPYANTLPAEVLTRTLAERFGIDDKSLCELGIQLASQGRASITLQCTHSDLRDAQFIPSS